MTNDWSFCHHSNVAVIYIIRFLQELIIHNHFIKKKKMDFPKYDGNVHPDEWINDIHDYLTFNEVSYNYNPHLGVATSLVDSTIKFTTRIDNFEKLYNALNDCNFLLFVFLNTVKEISSLRYIPERKGGNTSKFISTFCKLCYNAEINDVEEQKKYLYKSLPMNKFFSNEFYKKMKNVNSINELIKEFKDIVF
jgi:hypothetical protein